MRFVDHIWDKNISTQSYPTFRNLDKKQAGERDATKRTSGLTQADRDTTFVSPCLTLTPQHKKTVIFLSVSQTYSLWSISSIHSHHSQPTNPHPNRYHITSYDAILTPFQVAGRGAPKRHCCLTGSGLIIREPATSEHCAGPWRHTRERKCSLS